MSTLSDKLAFLSMVFGVLGLGKLISSGLIRSVTLNPTDQLQLILIFSVATVLAMAAYFLKK